MRTTARKPANEARNPASNVSSAGGGRPERPADGLGARWRGVLTTRYAGAHRVKRLARDFGVSITTAKSWLAGSAPRAEALERATRLFGLGTVAHVLGADAAEARLDALDADLDRLGAQMATLGAELRQLGRRDR